MSQRPTDEQLGEMLKTPHFGKSSDLPASDPVAPTPMVLSLDQIKPYDRNPRRERNPRYDEIKESIANQGELNNPLTVTRRPGEEMYMVESGGNTRLQILNELYEETGQETFNQIHVLYRPWKSETHVLTAHLIENDKRGDMLFIDKALGIRSLKQLFENENNIEELSVRKLAERLKAAGYSHNLDMISRMNYAVDVLLPVIPEALRAGMGRPQIARIRKIESAFQQYWSEISKQDASIFNELFLDCLAENNRAEWDADALRHTLEERIVELLDVPIRAMRLDIDALLSGREIEITPPPEESPWEEKPPIHSNTGESDDPVTVATGHAPSEQSSMGPASEPTDQQTGIQTTPSPTVDLLAGFGSDGNEDDAPDETSTFGIASLRKSAFETAHELAAHYSIEACVRPSHNWGLGFLIDLPEQPLISDDNQTLNAKERWQQVIKQWVWWLLYICSEETARPERIPNLPESMLIRRLCLEGNQQELMRCIGQPAWISLSYQLLADPLIPDAHFQLLITLIRHCRTLRQQLEDDNDDPLWLERNDYE
ncbi:MAG: ParB family protein [Candidatus Thiodiazotropha endolucinida]